MSRVVFLVEEYSMKVLLEGMLPRLFPGLPFACLDHNGSRDLEKSIQRKLRGWREPGVRFVVVRDNDGADCRVVKAGLVRRCQDGGHGDAVVRLACQELEAWYLGDTDALADAFEDERLRGLRKRKRFRDPDALARPAKVLEELIPGFQKVSGARRMATRLRPQGNTSRSFQAFLDGVERCATSLAADDHHLPRLPPPA